MEEFKRDEILGCIVYNLLNGLILDNGKVAFWDQDIISQAQKQVLCVVRSQEPRGFGSDHQMGAKMRRP